MHLPELTLEQCAALLDGSLPSEQFAIRERAEREALRLQQSRAAVLNRVRRGEISQAAIDQLLEVA